MQHLYSTLCKVLREAPPTLNVEAHTASGERLAKNSPLIPAHDMFREPMQVNAVRGLLVALETYESTFKSMVASDMASKQCADVEQSLEEIRQAVSLNPRDLLFYTIQLVLAHSSFTSTKLRRDELAKLEPDSARVSLPEIEALRDNHERAVKRLRQRCQSLLPTAL